MTGVSRTQSVQSHMNLITLQNEVTKNIANRAIATHKLSRAIEPEDMELLKIKENNAFILYFTSADKLASLINTEYLPKQFPNSKGEVNAERWKNEYYDIFAAARDSLNNYTGEILNIPQMI